MNLKLKLKHKAMAPKLNPVPLSSFQAEKMNKKVKRKKKNNLEKLFDQQSRRTRLFQTMQIGHI